MTLREMAEKAAESTWFGPCDHPKSCEVDTWGPLQKRGSQPRFLCSKCDERGMMQLHAGLEDWANSIERVAKEFAERAVRSMFEVTHQAHGKEVVSLTDPRSRTARNRDGVVIGAAYFGAFDLSCDTDRWPLSVEDFVDAAIAEADKDET